MYWWVVCREQLLRILLRITSAVLSVAPPIVHREKSLGDRLAEHLLKVSCSSLCWLGARKASDVERIPL